MAISAIDVQGVLRETPHFETFCSVEKLHSLVEHLRADARFAIETAGTSGNGVPIHHVRCGTGAVKALFVAGPHCMEPIGGLTVFSLMSMLHQGSRALLDADVEWHIVPCIDPDGAILNEGWTQQPFTLDNHMRHYYVQPSQDQADRSLPLNYKTLVFSQPSREAQVLQRLIERIRPDFYCSLHNARVGDGGFFLLTRDIGRRYHRQLQGLLEQFHIPLKADTRASGAQSLGEGIYTAPSIKAYYDYLEQKTTVSPEEALKGMGLGGPEYLLQIKDSALSLTPELIYIKHPSNRSQRETGQSLRQLKLRIDADTKFLLAAIVEEWGNVEAELDPVNPFYRKIFHEVVALKDTLHEGPPLTWAFEQTRELMLSPLYGGTMKENEQFFAWMWGRYMPLCNGYGFVRLLQGSKQTPAVRQATERLERVFDAALDDVARHVDAGAFEVIDCDTLAKVQLGSCLIVLNSMLEAQGQAAVPGSAP